MSGRLFSVVVPTYNRSRLLRPTLASVFAQEDDDWELIVVDDGSTDDTAEVVASFGQRVIYLRQENRGPSAARNAGIERARGRYVCALDSDDVWFPWTLSTFRTAITSAGEPALLVGPLVMFRGEDELAGVRRDPVVCRTYPDFLAASQEGLYASSGTAVYLRRALNRAGGFDSALMNMEDHDLSLRIGSAPGFVAIRSPITLGYRRHAGSVQTLERSVAGLLACIERERRGHYPGGAARARERRRLLCLCARPLVAACLRERRIDLASSVYVSTLGWQVREGRGRYLLGAPLLAAWAGIRKLA